MKQLLSLFILLFFTNIISAQDLSVKSFNYLENDLDARVHYPKKDQNGEIAAIIKVVTNEKGFSFDVGTLGIVTTEQKSGEVWVYVPRGVRRITISHPDLGLLRNYPLDIPVKAANVYELVLVSGRIEKRVIDKEIESQWLVIMTNPQGANVFIDEQLVGTTPFQRKYPEGDYNYRLENLKYFPATGKLSLYKEKKQIDVDLKPNFGSVSVTSSPEDGMQIFLNGENTGKTTPSTLNELVSGDYQISLISDWYAPQSKQIEVKPAQEHNLDFEMKAYFAELMVEASPDAEIFIDDKKQGQGSLNTRLLNGIYNIEIKKENYYSQKKQWQAVPGKSEKLNFTLEPKTGNIDVVSTPIGAKIKLNGENYGTTPNTLESIMIGNYALEISQQGFDKEVLDIEVKENKTEIVDVKLSKVNNTNKNYVSDIDGNQYKTVKIGEQEWMAENLKTTRYRNGDKILYLPNKNQWANTKNGAWTWYDNDSKHDNIYGKLYNWYAVNDSRGLCPTGWHVPSDKEWDILINYLGGKELAGNKMKNTTGWNENGNGNNQSGFTGLPGGFRYSNGTFSIIGSFGSWWSSTEYFTGYAWDRYLVSVFGYVDRDTNYKEEGLYVRCLKD